MRIDVLGTSKSVSVLKRYLEDPKVGYSTNGTLYHYRIHLNPTEGKDILVDGIVSPLETNVVNCISELCKARIILDRPGTNKSDTELRIGIPTGLEDAVERGVLRGILKTTFHGDGMKATKKSWYKLWSLALLVVLVGGSNGQLTPAIKPGVEPAIKRISAVEIPLTPKPLSLASKAQIREIQYQQDKYLLRMKEMEIEYKALKDKVDQLSNSMIVIVNKEALEQKLDTNKYSMDFDAVEFVPKK